jgi:hypothetical protein
MLKKELPNADIYVLIFSDTKILAGFSLFFGLVEIITLSISPINQISWGYRVLFSLDRIIRSEKPPPEIWVYEAIMGIV